MARNTATAHALRNSLRGQPPPPELAAHVKIKVEPADEKKEGVRIWSYTLYNDEPANSPHFINSFILDVAAPITVTGTPSGWAVLTDGNSNVLWYSLEQQPPNSNDIAPGAFLGGFEIQTREKRSKHAAVGIAAWNRSANKAGAVVLNSIRTPSQSVRD